MWLVKEIYGIDKYADFVRDLPKDIILHEYVLQNNFYIVRYWKDNPTEEEMHPKPSTR